MEYFEVEFNENAPCDELPFWEWLNNTYGIGKIEWPKNLYFIDAFTAYLVSLGFNKEVNAVSRETIDNHILVYKYWQESAPLVDYSKPLEFNDLFFPVDGEHGFYFCGLKKKYQLTDFAYEKIISKCGMIYSCNPRNYYFEVINGFLFMKYQSILGSRCLCSISGVPTE